MNPDIHLYNDHFQNWKSHQIQKAQLIVADIPYNIGKNAYGSNPSWYIDGDRTNGFEIKKEFYKAAIEKVLPCVQHRLF